MILRGVWVVVMDQSCIVIENLGFSPPQEEECQHEYEVNCFLCLPQRLDAHIGWLETGTYLSPNCFLRQDEAKEELSNTLESQ